ncbi:MAG: DsbA family protein [Chloroflexota bacterium]|nr:DsbA family protein [Chloroflexota bacterium]
MRREEARKAAAARAGDGRPRWPSPTILVSLAAFVVAVLVVVALNFGRIGSGSTNPGSGSSGPGTGAAGVKPPASPIPAAIPRDGRTLGSPTAKVVLDTWEDFQCPGCGSFSGSIEPVLIERYVASGQLRLNFHDYSFIGQESLDAASAARCAEKQGRFWDYQAWLFANQNGENQGWFSRDRLAAIADAVGLDRAAWATCYDSGAERAAVIAETQSGVSAGVTRTPTLVLDGTVVDVSTFTSWDQLFQAIDARIVASGGVPGGSAGPASAAP